MNCPYCNKPAEWVANKEVYGKNYGKSYMIWLCKPCDAYVGCHNNTNKPLGTIANRELRQWRRTAKEEWINSKLDGNWKNKKLRSKGYQWLGDLFGKEFHFGESTIEDCKKVLEYLAIEDALKQIK